MGSAAAPAAVRRALALNFLLKDNRICLHARVMKRPTTRASLAASGAGALPGLGHGAARADPGLPDFIENRAGEKLCLRAQNRAVN
jgi:hypothetical protein